jgi:large subunit ribosomal protein L6
MRLKPINIPENVSIEAHGSKIIVKGPKGTIEKDFKAKDIEIIVKGKDIEVKSNKKEMINTIRALINNMIRGVTEGFSEKLVIRYAHFPVKLTVKGNTLYIENFLGEKSARKATIPKGVVVKPSGQEILLESNDKEALGQAVANIRAAVRIKEKDIRVFQDGIYKMQ